MNQIVINQTNGDEYVLLEKIGQGSFADVFKGQKIKDKQIVAIKKMRNMRKADAQMAEKEIKLMNKLNHPNIIKCFDQFRFQGNWYIVLEYCGKGDLEKYKKKVGKIPEYHCKVLMKGILDALVQLHTQRPQFQKNKIAHRDLKLPNILIDDNYQLKLADFGFAKDFEDGWMKSFCGTPLTMAPEVLKRQQYDERCDVWSLGVITYYMIYNKYPFFPTSADGRGVDAITNCVVNKPLLFDPNVQITDAGKDFLISCLQKTLDKRPSAQELLKHPWFNVEGMRFTRIRQSIIGQSLGDRPERQAHNRCKALMFGVIQQHITKMFQNFLINQERIAKNIRMFRKYYQNHEIILEYYLLVIVKKLSSFDDKSFIVVLEDTNIKLQISKIKEYNIAKSKIMAFVTEKIIQIGQNKSDEVNLEKQIIKFLLNETELLMQTFNQDDIQDKLRLLKDLTNVIVKNYQKSIINVRWGEREDLSKQRPHIITLFSKIKEEDVLQMIGQQAPQQQEDLQSIWLIEHQISQVKNDKRASSMELELAKQVMYILSIPSNFTLDKGSSSSEFMLTFNNLQI